MLIFLVTPEMDESEAVQVEVEEERDNNGRSPQPEAPPVQELSMDEVSPIATTGL